VAIESGLGWTAFSIDDSGGNARDLRSSTFNLDWTMPRGVQDITTLAESAMARLLLLADFSGTCAGGFDDGSNLAHDVFKTVSSTSVERTMTITISGQTLANEVILTDYAQTRAQSGEFTWSVPFQLASGVVPTWA
jgi:hypothetical protein